MSQLVSRPHVSIGTMVSTCLYNRGRGYVFNIHGEQRPETVRAWSQGVVSSGGRAEFDIVFDSGHISRRLPECILHGVQWTIFDPDAGFADADHIKKLLDHAEQIRLESEKQAQEKARIFAQEVEALKTSSEYVDLEQGTESGGVLAAKNIRKLLKKHFPATRFSVRKAHWGSLIVKWENGPETSEVEEWTSRFIDKEFDLQSDCHRYVSTPWTEVFGSVGYISLYGP